MSGPATNHSQGGEIPAAGAGARETGPGEDGLRVAVEVQLREFRLDVDFRMEAGERLAIVGPSGAGKTTVLRSIAGLIRPDRGRIHLADRRLLDTENGVDVVSEQRGCGYLFQDYALFPAMTAWRNVAYGIRSGSRSERKAEAIRMLDRFGAVAFAEVKPSTLSGGERQRVALARVLASDPQVLLFDEPLSALDTATRGRSLRELDRALDDSGVPTVIVTHSFDEAAMLGDRIAVLDRGRIVQIGSAAEVSGRPASRFIADFAGAVVLDGEVRASDRGLTVIALDGGGELRSTDPATGRVAVSVYPWEVSLGDPNQHSRDSVLNHITGEVTSVTTVGNRVRVRLAAPQPIVAEITLQSLEALGLHPGARVAASWKATATRLIGRGPA